MSEQQIIAFAEAIKTDAGLMEQLKGAPNPDAVVAIAEAAGFMFSSEELVTSLTAAKDFYLDGDKELSEEELAGVTGGIAPIFVAAFALFGATTYAFGDLLATKEAADWISGLFKKR